MLAWAWRISSRPSHVHADHIHERGVVFKEAGKLVHIMAVPGSSKASSKFYGDLARSLLIPCLGSSGHFFTLWSEVLEPQTAGTVLL